jgi:hypothetical protein
MPQIKDGIDDVSRAYELYIVTSVFLTATVITTAARIGTKLAFRVQSGIDDWLIILGSVCDNKMKNKNIALTDIKALNVVADAFDYKATASGFSRHVMFLSGDELIQAAKYSQLAAYEFGTANHLKTGSSRRNTWNTEHAASEANTKALREKCLMLLSR